MIDERVRLYEQSPILEIAGETIRPGGLDLTNRALTFCALPIGARVLDVGCGPAASVEYLVNQFGLNAIGLDPSEKLLHSGRRSAHLPLVQSFGESLPLADDQFEVVLTECSLSVMRNTERALREFRRVLRPGGYLILSDIYARNADGIGSLQSLPIDSCLCGAVSQAQIIDRVEAAGFRVLRWEDHTYALNVFAARLIWSSGSLQQFWCRATSSASAVDIQSAIAHSRPGYYLLIAQKINR
ncbi:MAG: methyltransferase domain-containing protein [Thermoflexales bacterium]|nr:methyltransferase domain-containing protein [Thermoflexales bacterium]